MTPEARWFKRLQRVLRDEKVEPLDSLVIEDPDTGKDGECLPRAAVLRLVANATAR